MFGFYTDNLVGMLRDTRRGDRATPRDQAVPTPKPAALTPGGMSENNTLEASRGPGTGQPQGCPLPPPRTHMEPEPETLSKTRERQPRHSCYTRRSNLRELAIRQVLLKRTQLLRKPTMVTATQGSWALTLRESKGRSKAPPSEVGRNVEPLLSRGHLRPHTSLPAARPACCIPTNGGNDTGCHRSS